jgi:hypothetical protein
VIGALAVAIFASAVGCTQEQTSSGSVKLDATSDSTIGVAINSSGELHGSVVDGTACFWLDVPDSDPIMIVWPLGFTASTNPLKVSSPDGTVVATVGEPSPLISGTSPSGSRTCDGRDMRFTLASSIG